MNWTRPRAPFRSRIKAAPTALLLTIAMGLPMTATANGPDPVLGGLFAQGAALTFDWRAGNMPPDSLKAAIRAAAADANGTKVSQAPTFAWKAGGANPIGYGLGAPCGVNGIACFTRNAPVGFTMWFREQGHVFDWGSMKWCQTYQDPPNGCFDVETVALDEFGHIEGLAHHVNRANESDYLDAVVQTVSHARPEVGWNMHRFGVCDVATLQRIYDVPNTSAKISTCLNLATALTIAATPTVVAPGEMTTLIATLKIGPSNAYDRLKSNPLTGRSVTLQRRLAGTTTWIPAGTMSAGSASGTYVLGLRPSSPTEYRAVFITPGDEGINGSTSSIITVQVPDCRNRVCPQIVTPSEGVVTVP